MEMQKMKRVRDINVQWLKKGRKRLSRPLEIWLEIVKKSIYDIKPECLIKQTQTFELKYTFITVRKPTSNKRRFACNHLMQHTVSTVCIHMCMDSYIHKHQHFTSVAEV